MTSDKTIMSLLIMPELYRYNFSTAFGMAAIEFQEGRCPVKRIVLPDIDAPHCDGANGEIAGPAAEMPDAVMLLCKDIQAYFSGKPVAAPWEILDLEALTPLQQKVLRTVTTVSYGHTQTYGRIAARIGRPAAARFVGTTLRKNPFPVVIPCHRIIRSDGSPGAFAGGMEGTRLKKRLLALECSSRHEQGDRMCAKKIGV